MRAKFKVAFTVSVLLFTLLSPFQAQGSGEEIWRAPTPTSLNYKSVTILDSVEAADTFSRLWAEGGSDFSRYVCRSVEDVNCATAPNFDYQSVLPEIGRAHV